MLIKKSLALQAKAAILIDVEANKILFAKHATKRLHMASLTKLMTIIILLDKIDAGIIKWTDMVETSPLAASIRGSKMKLKPKEKLSVRNMFKGLLIASANDAAIALAEHISGSVSLFVEEMNNKGKELKLYNTHFVNPHGLSKKDHYSTALDIAKMAMKLINREEVLRYSKLRVSYIKNRKHPPKKLINTNELIGSSLGVDGLKTGHTPLAGYCLAATAKKEQKRVLCVVLGEPSKVIRDGEVIELLNYGFHYKQLNSLS